MIDLSTTYMGLKLKNPIVASSSPMSENVDTIKKMEDAGAGAVVMFSMFEEQLRQENAMLEQAMTSGTDSFSEALSYFPASENYTVGPDAYLELIQKATAACDIPILGSLNGTTHEGWIDYAKQIQQAGAKGLELNIYYIPTDPKMTGVDVEQRYLDVVKAVKSVVTIPVALKMSPFFSSIANFAKKVDDAGVDALVLFNRFYHPDFNIEELTVETKLNLSKPDEIRLPLMWIGILYGRIRASLGATRGVHSATEVIKYIMAGADVAMTTSSILKNGVDHFEALVLGLQHWMNEHEYKSVTQMRGSMSQKSVEDPSAFERANYIKVIESFKTAWVRGL